MTTDHADADHQPSESATTPRAPTHPRDSGRELELKLKKNPGDKQAQVDVGSDQSMDASDPPSATQPGGNEPVPSSGFPEKESHP